METPSLPNLTVESGRHHYTHDSSTSNFFSNSPEARLEQQKQGKEMYSAIQEKKEAE
jgi:hypothetical protein